MSKSISITDSRNELLQLPEQLGNEPVIVTNQGLPVMVAISYEQYISMLETMEILSDPEFKEQLIAGIQEDREGQRVSWAEAMKELEW
ncbi:MULTISPECIES: type II toxin-antitoxin system Phd/YefM family antitoxin [Nostocales]|uniref:Antitoxin n=3 Tax=Nostocales TaxID=1161 RepID=A0A8S9TDN8_9CYAN|nr:type II toxin-antitoxin system Phd/YefM family antitoxin [Tolypothrix bouteillei]KAF3889752.1 type II toxin-antitoxin system Phd/YefM family antitoxin [Tolypothrix bouteillei VB521301]